MTAIQYMFVTTRGDIVYRALYTPAPPPKLSYNI